MSDDDVLNQRIASLRNMIEDDRTSSERTAGKYLAYLTWYKLLAVALSGVSFVLGVVTSIWKQFKVDPAVFSAIAAATVGLTGLRQKFSWREQADTWYKRRDMLDKLLSRINYQIPTRPTADQVAEIARSYDAIRDAICKDLHTVNSQEDARWHPNKK
ncbi:hypothetical protein [Paraburkholderia tropica]|uniref:hypothetical protein n=1 Tax=Paraburkholderia tropica TaxID=92647 RepID=UPI003D2A3C35